MPLVSSKPRLGIVGGKGRMGRWFKRLFERSGYEVLIADLGTPLSNRDLAKRCDIVFVSVPMPVFGKVVEEIGPLLSPKQGLIDFCSLKKIQNEIMLAHTQAEVVAAHPLFGPGEKDLVGQKVAMWPSRGNSWFSWFKDFVETSGGKAVVVSPEEHDQAMAIIQVINHFMLLALGKLIEECGISLEHLKDLATPSFERQLDIVARFADQDPFLYGAIQFDNPEGEAVRQAYLKYIQKLEEIARKKDMKAFVELFLEVQNLGRQLKD